MVINEVEDLEIDESDTEELRLIIMKLKNNISTGQNVINAKNIKYVGKDLKRRICE